MLCDVISQSKKETKIKSLNETVLSVVKESSGINEATHREIKKEIELKISKNE